MFISFRGGTINYTDTGKGPAIVLLHGYLETSGVWSDFSQKLSRNFRIITIDLPGSNPSDVFGEVHSMELMADAVDAVIEELNPGKIFMTGHSMGGYVTLAYLGKYPNKLTGYCLFHSSPFPDTPATKERRKYEIQMVRSGLYDQYFRGNIKKMYASTNLEKFSDFIERSIDTASGLPAEGITAVLNGMIRRPSQLALMEEGKVPCLWVLGTFDNYIPYETMRTRVRLPSNGELAVLSASGHMGFIEEEETAIRLISDFVNGCC